MNSREAEGFLFHTRLAHVSDAMKEKDPRARSTASRSWRKAPAAAQIGESLQTFNRWQAARVLHSRSCVMIVSDGYETGDARLLGREMAAIGKALPPHRLAHPMMAVGGYAPEAPASGRVAVYRSLCAANTLKT